MRRPSVLGTTIGVVTAIALSGAALAFTDPSNGSFESGTFVDGGAGFQALNAGDTSLTGWTITTGSIDWIGSYWPAVDGSKSIDMSGNAAGAISQTFATTIGNTYTVTFALSGNPAGGPTVKTLTVGATGAASANLTFDTVAAGSTLTDMKWSTRTYTFLATTASTTLTFTSTTAGVYGPALDKVVVTEKVPTKADCKKGGWKTKIDGKGNKFKNQGDCVSYYATGGRNLGSVKP